jgi:hypothetical protein
MARILHLAHYLLPATCYLLPVTSYLLPSSNRPDDSHKRSDRPPQANWVGAEIRLVAIKHGVRFATHHTQVGVDFDLGCVDPELFPHEARHGSLPGTPFEELIYPQPIQRAMVIPNEPLPFEMPDDGRFVVRAGETAHRAQFYAEMSPTPCTMQVENQLNVVLD